MRTPRTEIDKDIVDASRVPVLKLYKESGAARVALVAAWQASRSCIPTNDKPLPPGYSIHELGTSELPTVKKKSVLNHWSHRHRRRAESNNDTIENAMPRIRHNEITDHRIVPILPAEGAAQWQLKNSKPKLSS